MSMAESVFEAVKQSVTVREAAQMYGIEINRSGMACCPFHDDKNPSMKLNEEYFYCFGCGATGDVIDFTARLYNLSPKEAAEKLAQDFGLAYDSQAPPRRRYVRQKTEVQKFKEDRDHAFRVLADYFHLLRRWETDYTPKTPEENPHPRFMEAIQKKDYVGYLLDFFLEDGPEEQRLWIAEHQTGIDQLERRVKFMADKPTNRERLQEITAGIEQGIKELFESEKYMRYLAVLALLLILSKHIVRPVAESYEKQKQFITDAGHELKTPMTIISADADLVEMECGENQWISDIRRQTQRLIDLTNDLIYLSRMDEEQPKLQLIDFPLSDVTEEMAQSFQSLAKSQEKEFSLHIQPMLSFHGDEKAIRQLLSILLDNALKYSPIGGRLELRLEKQGRMILLTVANTSAQPVEQDKLSHLFDRFYRTDQSRNSQTGGYGLGLSIARSVVLAHKGKIRTESPDGRSLIFIIQLPV